MRNYQKIFWIFLLILSLEIFSYSGFIWPFLREVVFFILIASFLILSLLKLEYGFYFVLVELLIGSKGYLFYFEKAGISISIRLAIFLIILGVWFFRVLQGKIKLDFLKSKFVIFYFLLSIFLIWGVIQGFLSRNRFDNLFFDVNGWLYFGLLPLFVTVNQSKKVIGDILNIFIAALFWLFLKTTVLFYFFSHLFEFIQPSLYQWVKLTGIGEITKTGFGFSRIFFQSQIYFLVGFFIILTYWAFRHQKFSIFYFLFSIFLFTFPLLVSFSRSFWFGLFAGLMFFLIIAKLKMLPWQKIGQIIFSLLIVVIFNFIFLIFILALPPEGIFLKDFRALTGRFELEKEPAALSRFEQIGPLFKKIKIRPIFGSGFGTTVTYHSFDPRAIEKYKGQYTTYAFEWGYFDIVLKIGLLGLGTYLLLIWKILKAGWKQIFNSQFPIFNIGLLFGLIAILFVNIFSPYLNHPLGIGYLMMVGAILNSYH